MKTWNEIQRRISKATKPALIMSEQPIVLRILRDIFSEEFEAIYVDNKEIKEKFQGILIILELNFQIYTYTTSQMTSLMHLMVMK